MSARSLAAGTGPKWHVEAADGTSGDVLTTDGAGAVTWQTPAAPGHTWTSTTGSMTVTDSGGTVGGASYTLLSGELVAARRVNILVIDASTLAGVTGSITTLTLGAATLAHLSSTSVVASAQLIGGAGSPKNGIAVMSGGSIVVELDSGAAGGAHTLQGMSLSFVSST